MRLATVASLRRIPEQHVPALGKHDVVRGDVQIRDGRHDFGVRVGVVERRLAGREGGWCGEPGVGRAEVLDGGATFIMLGRVRDGHVFFDHGNVLLQGRKTLVAGVVGEWTFSYCFLGRLLRRRLGWRL